jgi:hypothetical protein
MLRDVVLDSAPQYIQYDLEPIDLAFQLAAIVGSKPGLPPLIVRAGTAIARAPATCGLVSIAFDFARLASLTTIEMMIPSTKLPLGNLDAILAGSSGVLTYEITIDLFLFLDALN